MEQSTFTFHVDADLAAAFGEAAKAQNKTGADLLREFMQDIVAAQEAGPDYDVWFRRQVELGLADADAGRLISSEEVEQRFAARRAETVRQIKEQR